MSIRDELKQGRQMKVIAGQDIMHAQRFAEDTRHMIIFDVLTNDTVGSSGERLRVFLSDDGYERAERVEEQGNISIIRRYQVRKGDLIYIPYKPKRKNKQMMFNI